MKSPLQALIQMGVVPTVTFPTDSRYYGFSTLTYMTPTGEQHCLSRAAHRSAAGPTEFRDRRAAHGTCREIAST